MSARQVLGGAVYDHGDSWQFVFDTVSLSELYRFSFTVEGDLSPPAFAYLRYQDTTETPSPNVDLPCFVVADPQGNGQTQIAVGAVGGAIPPQTTQITAIVAKPPGAGKALGGRLFVEPL